MTDDYDGRFCCQRVRYKWGTGFYRGIYFFFRRPLRVEFSRFTAVVVLYNNTANAGFFSVHSIRTIYVLKGRERFFSLPVLLCALSFQNFEKQLKFEEMQ